MPGSPQLSLSLRFPHQNPVHASPLSHMCSSHSPWSDHLHKSGWELKIIKLLIM
jgi:hypothetical protein